LDLVEDDRRGEPCYEPGRIASRSVPRGLIVERENRRWPLTARDALDERALSDLPSAEHGDDARILESAEHATPQMAFDHPQGDPLLRARQFCNRYIGRSAF